MRWDAAAKTWTNVARHIDVLGVRQIVWFRNQKAIAVGATDSDTFLYLDNPSPPPIVANTGVFDMFAPFDASSSAWAQQGNVNFFNGAVILDGTNVGGSIRSAGATWGVRYAVDFWMAVEAPVVNNSQWFCGGFQRENDFVNNAPWSLWISRTSGDLVPEFYSSSGNVVGSKFAVDSPNGHYYSIERFPTTHRFRRDFAVVDSLTVTNAFTAPMQVRFSAYAGSRLSIDFARVRQAFPSPPGAVLVNAEQGP